MLSRLFVLVFIFFCCIGNAGDGDKTVVIGSKRFSENYILAEIFSQLLEANGYKVDRRFGLGGSMAAYEALKNQSIDVYPEYTGTIAQAILKTDDRDYAVINKKLKEHKLTMLGKLGFNNAYCLAMRRDLAEKENIKTIGDLRNHRNFKGGLSFEFVDRKDGWEGLKKVYGLSNEYQKMNFPLTYEALKNKKLEFAEAYTTEPLVEKYDLIILEDDLHYFPRYDAAPLVHDQISLEVRNILNKLTMKIDEPTIMGLTGQLNEGKSIALVAKDYLLNNQFITEEQASQIRGSKFSWSELGKQTKTHLLLTGLAVLLATLIAVPLTTLLADNNRASQALLSVTGILQTIPSIALLTFLIPFMGIGFKPAITGLFIYSLLPIIRNTHTAMTTIDPRLITAARGIGLYPSEIFWSVKLPLAFPTILAGIRTATTLNIGTATLAAFIGGGGLGEPIVTGLAINDNDLVLQGAIPSALLAIVVDAGFALINRSFTKDI